MQLKTCNQLPKVQISGFLDVNYQQTEQGLINLDNLSLTKYERFLNTRIFYCTIHERSSLL